VSVEGCRGAAFPATYDCDVQRIDYAVGSRRTATTLVGVQRPGSAIVDAAIGAVSGTNSIASGEGVNSNVTVSGIGFFAAATRPSCRIVATSPSLWIVGTSVAATVHSGVHATCVFAALMPAANALLLFSQDGENYGAVGAAMSVVGPRAHLRVRSRLATVIYGAGRALLPSFSVETTDALGSARGRLEGASALLLVCSSLTADEWIGGASERVAFDGDGLLRLRTALVNGSATLSDVWLVAPQVGTVTLHCFLRDDLAVATSILFEVLEGAVERLEAAEDVHYTIGVTGARVMEPPFAVRAVDGAGNTVTNALLGVAALRARVAREARASNSSSAMVVQWVDVVHTAALSADGRYVFDDVALRTTFGTSIVLEARLADLESVFVELRADICPTAQRAVRGTFECAPCPAHAVCDWTPEITSPAGYWRAAPTALEVHSCGVSSACAGNAVCGPGYEGLRCQACALGYGKSAGVCERCLPRGLNVFLIILLCVAAVGVTAYLSIGSMRLRDASQLQRLLGRTADGDHWSAVSTVIKLAITHLQVVGMVPVVNLGFPEWVTVVTGGAGRGTQASASISVVSCVVGDDALTQLRVQLILFALLVLGVLLISFMISVHDAVGSFNVFQFFALLLAAKHDSNNEAAGRDTNVYRMRRRQSLGQRKFHLGTATSSVNVHTTEVVIADDAHHFEELQRNHRVLLDDDDYDAVAGPTRQHDISLEFSPTYSSLRKDDEKVALDGEDDKDTEPSESGGALEEPIDPPFNFAPATNAAVVSTNTTTDAISMFAPTAMSSHHHQRRDLANEWSVSATGGRAGANATTSIGEGSLRRRTSGVFASSMTRFAPPPIASPSIAPPLGGGMSPSGVGGSSGTNRRRSLFAQSLSLLEAHALPSAVDERDTPPEGAAGGRGAVNTVASHHSSGNAAFAFRRRTSLKKIAALESSRFHRRMSMWDSDDEDDDTMDERQLVKLHQSHRGGAEGGGRTPPRSSKTTPSPGTSHPSLALSPRMKSSFPSAAAAGDIACGPSVSVSDQQLSLPSHLRRGAFEPTPVDPPLERRPSMPFRESMKMMTAELTPKSPTGGASLGEMSATEAALAPYRAFYDPLLEDEPQHLAVGAPSTSTGLQEIGHAAIPKRKRKLTFVHATSYNDEFTTYQQQLSSQDHPYSGSHGTTTVKVLPRSTSSGMSFFRSVRADDERDGQDDGGLGSVRGVVTFVWVRTLNMAVCGAVCALFLLYPSLVGAAAALLDCVTIEANSRDTVHVLRSDPTTSCTDASYAHVQTAAWLVLICVGLGGPLLSAASVVALARTTCGGSMEVARMMLHFVTGGYREAAWFWEVVVLYQKLMLVLCTTVLGDDLSRVLGSTWTIGLVLYLTFLLRQFDQAALLYAQIVSLSTIAMMFGLSGVAFVLRDMASAAGGVLNEPTLSESLPRYLTAIGSLVGALQLCAMAAFVAALVWLLGREIRVWIEGRSNQCLVECVTSVVDHCCNGGELAGLQSVESRELQAAQCLRRLRGVHERFFETLVAEHYATELLREILGYLEQVHGHSESGEDTTEPLDGQDDAQQDARSRDGERSTFTQVGGGGTQAWTHTSDISTGSRRKKNHSSVKLSHPEDHDESKPPSSLAVREPSRNAPPIAPPRLRSALSPQQQSESSPNHIDDDDVDGQKAGKLFLSTIDDMTDSFLLSFDADGGIPSSQRRLSEDGGGGDHHGAVFQPPTATVVVPQGSGGGVHPLPTFYNNSNKNNNIGRSLEQLGGDPWMKIRRRRSPWNTIATEEEDMGGGPSSASSEIMKRHSSASSARRRLQLSTSPPPLPASTDDGGGGGGSRGRLFTESDHGRPQTAEEEEEELENKKKRSEAEEEVERQEEDNDEERGSIRKWSRSQRQQQQSSRPSTTSQSSLSPIGMRRSLASFRRLATSSRTGAGRPSSGALEFSKRRAERGPSSSSGSALHLTGVALSFRQWATPHSTTITTGSAASAAPPQQQQQEEWSNATSVVLGPQSPPSTTTGALTGSQSDHHQSSPSRHGSPSRDETNNNHKNENNKMFTESTHSNPILQALQQHERDRYLQQHRDRYGGDGTVTLAMLRAAVLDLQEALEALRRVWDWVGRSRGGGGWCLARTPVVVGGVLTPFRPLRRTRRSRRQHCSEPPPAERRLRSRQQRVTTRPCWSGH
jgi:hypothetical protein